MPDFSYVRADGERIKDLDSVHVPHPDAPPVFGRSSLVVGSRGVGKTVLLRVRKKHQHPGAIYVNLMKALHSITRGAGLGGRGLIFDEASSVQIQAKTAAILAVVVLEAVAKENPSLGQDPVSHMSPLLSNEISAAARAHRDNATALKYRISQQPLGAWGEVPALEILTDVLLSIDDRRELETMLFLDRAEDAPRPSAQLLMGLLDQSFGLVTVIASRPGLAEQISADPSLMPGDHFDLIHLGTQPYSDPWVRFSTEAISRYVEINTGSVPRPGDLAWAVRMGRDSLRQMIELAWIGRETSEDVRLRAAKVAELRNLARTNAQARMRPHSFDFIEAMDEINSSVGSKMFEDSEQFALVWNVSWVRQQVDSLASDVIRRALSHELLLYPQGESWNPFELPSSVEVPPIFLWNKGLLSWIR